MQDPTLCDAVLERADIAGMEVYHVTGKFTPNRLMRQVGVRVETNSFAAQHAYRPEPLWYALDACGSPRTKEIGAYFHAKHDGARLWANNQVLKYVERICLVGVECVGEGMYGYVEAL